MLNEIGRYSLPSSRAVLTISQGSVVDFKGDCIINAANAGCVHGGGVDGAISKAGGRNLREDRYNLPVLDIRQGKEIRCFEGEAVITGPNNYGTLPSYIIHAVGPNFSTHKNIRAKTYKLQTAYTSSLTIANEKGLKRVGFSLLSAGLFRGPLSLDDVLYLGIKSIMDWADYMGSRCNVEEIHMCAFTEQECYGLRQLCNSVLSIATPPQRLDDDRMRVPDLSGINLNRASHRQHIGPRRK